MAKATTRVQKVLRKADPMKTKTGKLKLSTLSMEALEGLKKTTKAKNMAKVEKEIAKRQDVFKNMVFTSPVITPLIKPMG